MPSFSRFMRDIMNSRIIAGLLVLASIIFGALTFATFTGFSSLAGASRTGCHFNLF